MALFSELLTTIIILATWPFPFLKLLCLFGVKTVFFGINMWTKLVKAVVSFHVNLFWRIIIWSIAFISLPGRILATLQRERQLELLCHDMQIELENLLWDRKELQKHLQRAIKENKMKDLILAELEEEHDKVLAKLELLVGELQDLKSENLRLKEIQGKGYYDLKVGDERRDLHNTTVVDYGIPSWKSSYDGSGIVLEDLLMHEDGWDDEKKPKTDSHKMLGTRFVGPLYRVMPETNTRIVEMDEAFKQRRVVAMKQSLFSAGLSLLVGIIIWQAEDPCMPLVVALFTVVGISLKSVVKFFSTIKNKPASDAVALLSFNWFILGTLTYPTLPRVAHMVAPVAMNFADRALIWLGFAFS